MKKKGRNVIIWILICCFMFIVSPVDAVAAKKDTGKTLTLTNKNVKNGKIIVKNKDYKEIVVKKSIKNAEIQLSNVKVSGSVSFEKGDYTLKTTKTTIGSLSMTQKGSNIILDKKADLNQKKLVVKVKKSASGNLELPGYTKKLNVELGQKAEVGLSIGTKEKVQVTVTKSYTTSKLTVAGMNESAKLKSMEIKKPVAVTVEIDLGSLKVGKAAEKAIITLNGEADKVQNAGEAEIKQREQEEETKKEEEKKEENKNTSDGGSSFGGGGYYVPVLSEKEKQTIAKNFATKCDEIKVGLAHEEGRRILQELERTRAALTNAEFERLVELEKKEVYTALKKELKALEELNSNSITLDNKGKVSLKMPWYWDADCILVKKEAEVKELKVLKAGETNVSMLEEMRRNGLGEYFVRVEFKFQYLATKSVNSNVQTVTELENPFGATVSQDVFRVNGVEELKQAVAVSGAGISNDSGTITIKNGKLSWKPVDNAQFYDIYGYASSQSQNNFLGKVYLKGEGNKNNDRAYETLEVTDHRSPSDGNKVAGRILCAGDIQDSMAGIALSELIVFSRIGQFFNEEWIVYKDDPIILEFLIIPRNTESLYINSILNDSKHPQDNGGVTSFIIENITFKELFLHVFGEDIESPEKMNGVDR